LICAKVFLHPRIQTHEARHLIVKHRNNLRGNEITKVFAYAAAAKAAAFVAALVLFAPVAFVTLSQASQIVA
jgi:hypothetical protein